MITSNGTCRGMTGEGEGEADPRSLPLWKPPESSRCCQLLSFYLPDPETPASLSPLFAHASRVESREEGETRKQAKKRGHLYPFLPLFTIALSVCVRDSWFLASEKKLRAG